MLSVYPDWYLYGPLINNNGSSGVRARFILAVPPLLFEGQA